MLLPMHNQLVIFNAQVTYGGKVPKKPEGCSCNHIPKVLEQPTGLPNPQPSHESLHQAPLWHPSHLSQIAQGEKKIN